LPFSFSEIPRHREPIVQLVENDGAHVGAQGMTAASGDRPGFAPSIQKPYKICAFAAIADLP
jgi:hypothetical protein